MNGYLEKIILYIIYEEYTNSKTVRNEKKKIMHICIFVSISERKLNFLPSETPLSHLRKIRVLNKTFIYNLQRLLVIYNLQTIHRNEWFDANLSNIGLNSTINFLHSTVHAQEQIFSLFLMLNCQTTSLVAFHAILLFLLWRFFDNRQAREDLFYQSAPEIHLKQQFIFSEDTKH